MPEVRGSDQQELASVLLKQHFDYKCLVFLSVHLRPAFEEHGVCMIHMALLCYSQSALRPESIDVKVV